MPPIRYATSLAVLAAMVALAGYAAYVVPGPLPAQTAVDLPRVSTRLLATILRDHRVVAQPLVLRAAAALTREAGPLRAGEYAIPRAASLRAVLAILRHGQPVQHALTIPEGLTAAQIARLLADAGALAGPVPVPEEAGVLPDTYRFLRHTPRDAVLARAHAALASALSTAWAGRATGLPLANPADALVLASIVERETATPAERPHVAAVFLNRLRLGMKLQSDPTAAYAATGGLGPPAHPLTRADLDLDNPYNTYRRTGLPPGPICAPGAASIDAVLHPAASPDLYFVADGTGGHAFAATLADHSANVARWRARAATIPPP